MEDDLSIAGAAEKTALVHAQQYLAAEQCTALRAFVSDAVRLQGMPQLSGVHFTVLEGEDVPDMVSSMVEQEAASKNALQVVEGLEARIAGIHAGQSQLLPGQEIEDVEASLESGMLQMC